MLTKAYVQGDPYEFILGKILKLSSKVPSFKKVKSISSFEELGFKEKLIITLSLAKAQERLLFVHGNLTKENISIESCSLTNLVFNIEGFEYTVENVTSLPVIHNFENSRITYKGFPVSLLPDWRFHPKTDINSLFQVDLTPLQFLEYLKENNKEDFKNNLIVKRRLIKECSNFNKSELDIFEPYISPDVPDLDVIYINFPFEELQHFQKIQMKVDRLYRIYSNYLAAVKKSKCSISPDFFVKKRKLFNQSIALSEIPLHKFYTKDFGTNNEGVFNWLKSIFPSTIDYLNNLVLIPELVERVRPCSLNQFNYLKKNFPNELKSLLEKMKLPYPVEGNDLKVFENYKNQSGIDIWKKDEESRAKRSKNRAKTLYELLKTKNITSVLDFGGDDGSTCSAIAEIFKIKKENAISADIKTWLGDTGRNQDYQNITYLVLQEGKPIPLDKKIDLVVCFQTLHHVKDLDLVLGELSRICKRYLYIREHDCIDPVIIDVEHTIYEKGRLEYLNDYHDDYKSKSEWEKIFNKKGFTSINVTVPYGHSRIYNELFEKM